MPSKTPSPYKSPWSNTETTALARSYHVPSIQTTEGIAGNLPWMPSHDNRGLGVLYRLRNLIPGDASLPEVGLVRHMTRERGIVAEHDVLRHRFPGTHGVKVGGEMRGLFVEVGPANRNGFLHALLPRLRVMLLMPLLLVRLAQRPRVAAGIVARPVVLAGLRREMNLRAGHLHQSLGAVEAVGLGRLCSELEPHRHGQVAVVIDHDVHVGHVAAVFPAADAADGCRLRRRLIHSRHEQHAADQVNQQIARQAGAVLFPAAPAREDLGIEGPFRDGPLPGVPVEGLRREIGRRRILPGAGGVVTAEPSFDHHHLAEHALRDHFFRLRADLRADALRADLYDAATLLRGVDHRHTVGGAVRHRFLAVDVLPGADRIDDDLLVPVIGNGGHDAVDVLVAQQLLVAARDWEIRPHDLTRERVTAIVEVGGASAFDAGQLNGRRQQTAALHAHSDHPEPHAIARSNAAYAEPFGGKGGAGCGRARLEEFATGPVLFAHRALP